MSSHLGEYPIQLFRTLKRQAGRQRGGSLTKCVHALSALFYSIFTVQNAAAAPSYGAQQRSGNVYFPQNVVRWFFFYSTLSDGAVAAYFFTTSVGDTQTFFEPTMMKLL